ncbi:hypothetical protein BD31_I0816 [Candidatus Nitrosopumilus salaria BD31]|uniref:Uncharacterized protein n=1 Tax=Candidatus Nitrosopumilus salarius BD31 TaxID=859350 RepID=I3D222_9ARCH|nr:hypothetical protein [Candidatus Nitrosopumilus salaria]EIJ65765.1 hypothetical protein BD31_I0816 [Candidatus Nitrosopumilus salaria BD31]
MKYLVIFLLLASFSVIAFAEPIPEPKSESNITNENCGSGTTLQNGICVVDKSQNMSSKSSEKWPSPYQKDNKVSGSIMTISNNVIPPGQTMFVNGTFNQQSDDFTVNIFKDYEDSRDLVLTLSPSSHEFGGFNFNFTIPNNWKLGNYHIVLENGLQEMDWQFVVRQNHSGGSLDHTVYPVPWMIESPLKQFKSGIPIDEIQCNESLILVIKNNNTPACVKEQTLLKLVERELIITSKTERDLMLDAGYKLYPGVGWVQGGQENLISSEPESPPISVDHQNLIDARNKLREAYHANASLGPFNIKDVIVGYGIGDGFLVVDILEKYYDSDADRKSIIQKITDITGEKVDIEFNSSVAIIPTSIESVFPYIWNGFLHRNGIEFTPKEQSYSNTDIGFRDVNRVCSPIIASNGTELYISSVFVYEPFEITGTYVDKIKPDDCYKIWKTDAILVEPTRELGMWLENYWEKEHEN